MKYIYRYSTKAIKPGQTPAHLSIQIPDPLFIFIVRQEGLNNILFSSFY